MKSSVITNITYVHLPRHNIQFREDLKPSNSFKVKHFKPEIDWLQQIGDGTNTKQIEQVNKDRKKQRQFIVDVDSYF